MVIPQLKPWDIPAYVACQRCSYHARQIEKAGGKSEASDAMLKNVYMVLEETARDQAMFEALNSLGGDCASLRGLCIGCNYKSNRISDQFEGKKQKESDGKAH